MCFFQTFLTFCCEIFHRMKIICIWFRVCLVPKLNKWEGNCAHVIRVTKPLVKNIAHDPPQSDPYAHFRRRFTCSLLCFYFSALIWFEVSFVLTHWAFECFAVRFGDYFLLCLELKMGVIWHTRDSYYIRTSGLASFYFFVGP